MDLLSGRSEILASDQEMPHGGADKSGGIAETTGLNLLFDEALCFRARCQGSWAASLIPCYQADSVRTTLRSAFMQRGGWKARGVRACLGLNRAGCAVPSFLLVENKGIRSYKPNICYGFDYHAQEIPSRRAFAAPVFSGAHAAGQAGHSARV